MLLQVGCSNITMRWQQFITPINTKSRSSYIVLYQTLWEQMFMLGSVETSLQLLTFFFFIKFLMHFTTFTLVKLLLRY